MSRDGEIELKIEIVQPRDDSEWAGAGHALENVHQAIERGARRAWYCPHGSLVYGKSCFSLIANLKKIEIV